jgi:hypothetical protein
LNVKPNDLIIKEQKASIELGKTDYQEGGFLTEVEANSVI